MAGPCSGHLYGYVSENRGYTMPSLVTMSGIMTDSNLCALNKERKPIKGLFVPGNTLGECYALGYSTPFAGNSIGMALTHGWLAGKFVTSIS